MPERAADGPRLASEVLEAIGRETARPGDGSRPPVVTTRPAGPTRPEDPRRPEDRDAGPAPDATRAGVPSPDATGTGEAA